MSNDFARVAKRFDQNGAASVPVNLAEGARRFPRVLGFSIGLENIPWRWNDHAGLWARFAQISNDLYL